MGETAGTITNGADHANNNNASSSDSSPPPGPDDQPPIPGPPVLNQSPNQSNVATIEKSQTLLPHTLDAQRVAHELRTDACNGLTSEDAASRLARDGQNAIKGAKGVSIWEIFLQQVANALTVVLIAVAALSFAIDDYVEGGVVVAVIMLNIVVGCVILCRNRNMPRRVSLVVNANFTGSSKTIALNRLSSPCTPCPLPNAK